MRLRRKTLVRALGVLLIGLLGSEVGLRWFLFGNPESLRPIAARFRNELHYTRAQEDDCWKLRALFRADGGRPHSYRDEHLGWTNEDIEPVTYRHRAEPAADGRQLVLLYGDSFARCLGERSQAWEGLLAGSELGATHVLLNFGVGGYGLDQIHLLLAATIDRYVARAPLVVVALLVDDSLDRCALSLRNFPKPRFELSGSEMVLHPVLAHSAAEFLAAHPIRIRSYLWRFTLHGSELVPEGLSAWLRGNEPDAMAPLCHRLLAETRLMLEARGLRHFVLLFHARDSLESPGPFSWQEPFLYESLRELDLSFVSSKRALLEDMAATGRPVGAYFSASQHYTASANAAVFPALARGIRGEFEPPEGYLPGAPLRTR